MSGRERSRRRARWTAAALVLIVLAILLSPKPRSTGGGPASRPPPAGERFGVNVNRLFNDLDHPAGQITAQLQALRATGAAVARSDALWEATEPAAPAGGAHHYDWRFDDGIAASLAAQGLAWLPIVDYSAPWAQSVPGEDHSPPSSPDAYAAYAAALAGRYGAGGTFWRSRPGLAAQPVETFEIWNEPDSASFWMPRPDARRYAVLYLLARGAIASVEPQARVIVGGLSHPEAFLPQMLTAAPALRGHLDGVAIHPYGPNPTAVLAAVRNARQTLDRLGLERVPLYVTEFGWTTRPRGTTNFAPAGLRPGYIRATMAELGHTGCGLSTVLLYTWMTPERDPRNADDWFGIAPPDGASSPDVLAFTQGLLEARRVGPRPATC